MADVEAEISAGTGPGEAVSEFEVEGMGEGVDVGVVMANVWIVADVGRFDDEEGIWVRNAFWKKAEEDAIVVWVEPGWERRGKEKTAVYNSVVGGY